MPITDLDGRYRPQRLGKVRLGRTKEKKIKGKTVEIPYATEYFVIDELPEEIREEYGDEPTTLRIEFLFNTIDQVFPHYHKYFLRRGLRCMGDGEMVLYRAGGTVEEPVIYIKNGAFAVHDDTPLEEWEDEYGIYEEFGNTVRCWGFDCPTSQPGKCRPTGRLCFAIQGHEALGFYEMGTRSINAIAGIVGSLKLALMAFGHLDNMPWLLHLRPEIVQAGGKGRKIYVPIIQIDPPWMQKHWPMRGAHLRAVEERRRADIVDLYGVEDVEELEFEPTSPALLEAAREEEGHGEAEEPSKTARETLEEAEAVVEEVLGEMESDSVEGVEIVTESGLLHERLMADANHNLEKRGYKVRYRTPDEIRQALETAGISGMMKPDKYLEYLTIVLDAKEGAE